MYQSAETDDIRLAVWDATSKQIVSKSIEEVDWGKSSTFKIAQELEVLRMHFKLLRWVFEQFGCDPPSSCDCGCGQKHGRKRVQGKSRGGRKSRGGGKPCSTNKRPKAKVVERRFIQELSATTVQSRSSSHVRNLPGLRPLRTMRERR